MNTFLRDRIGQVLSDEIAEQPQADFCDSREIDRLADAVIALLIPKPSIREMLLEDLVRRFMLATATTNGEAISEAHDAARKLLRMG